MNIHLLIQSFLKENDLNDTYIELLPEEKHQIDVHNTDIIYSILIDTFNLNSENVKLLTNLLSKKGIKLGRQQKDIIKKYYDYQDIKYLHSFLDTITTIDKEVVINDINQFNEDNKEKVIEEFKKYWNQAIEEEDNKKIKDYLYGIYSKLINIFCLNSVSLMDLFLDNKEYLVKELNSNSISIFQEYCLSNSFRGDLRRVSKKFNDKYLKLKKDEYQAKSRQNQLSKLMNQPYFDENIDKNTLVQDRGQDIQLFDTESKSLVHFNITQDVFNQFSSKVDFYNYILFNIREIYRILENHKVFSIKIDNIYDGAKNLKWDIYSKITLYAENFIEVQENRNFYKPEILLKDYLSKDNILLTDNDISLCKSYYKEKINFEALIEKLSFIIEDKILFKDIVNQFKIVHYGFTFIDCFILNKESEEYPTIGGIKNKNELLVIFNKNRFNDDKIPCPSCGSLHISGNSYTEVGLKSWECKNPICPDRSKSNRGKRYSVKSNFMQWGSFNNDKDNLITKDLISKWRKDIVSIADNQEIYYMIIKYFTFPNEDILFINTDLEVKNMIETLNRKPQVFNLIVDNNHSYISNIDIPRKELSIYEDFFQNSSYIKRFLIEDTNIYKKDKNLSEFVQSSSTLKLINGNCLNVMKSMEENSIDALVTSPPYYNVREYSHWSNLYLYLINMYHIIEASYHILKPGHMFLFNIGDIFDNPNTVTKSNMGKKRLPLSAYFIFLFEKVGFELVDNLIWDKGEPQSNRQKNDGKFTPHYQKPINAYEHMFLFKKPGAEIHINIEELEKIPEWKGNIIYFSPVIKINQKGENKYGHTAPFPKDIPDFVTKVFTKANDKILDPFSGSLTSALVSVENNRIGIGIELSEEYIELSKHRASTQDILLDIFKYK